jgi:hypothetical protein
MFHVAYAMPFVGGYLLARELGAGRAGAAVAGVAFAYAPWRLEHDSHLNILSSGGIPLALFLGLRGYRQQRPGLVVAGWLVAAWQLTLGNNLGLQFAYLLLVLGVVVCVWAWRTRPRFPRPLVVATVVGMGAFLLVGWLYARPYLEVREEHRVVRTLEEVDFFSTSPKSFAAASSRSSVWSNATSGVREQLEHEVEQSLFPGLAILVLAIIGSFSRAYPRSLRVGLAAGTFALAVLSLGLTVDGNRLLQPYRLLYDYAPGWDGVRVPERLMTLTTLGLALLAAAGAAAIVRRAHRLPAVLVGAVLAGAVLAEGAAFDLRDPGRWVLRGPFSPTVPEAPFVMGDLPDPQLHLPAQAGEASQPQFVLWSTDGFPQIVNGLGSFGPASYTEVQRATKRFPDCESVELLRSMGVRTVVLHPELAAGTPWSRSASRSGLGLGLRRREEDGLVIWSIANAGTSPCPSRAHRAGPPL